VKTLTKDEIIARLVEVFLGYLSFSDAWNPILFDPQRSVEDFIKDRAFPLYFGCILDMVKNIDHSDPNNRLLRSAKEIDDNYLQHNAKMILGCGVIGAELLCRIPENEQIFLQVARDRFVHGFLEGHSKPSRNYTVIIPIIASTKNPFTKVNKTQNEIHDLIQQFGGGDLMNACRALRTKHTKSFSLYSQTMSQLIDFDPRATNLDNHLANGNVIISDTQRHFTEFNQALDALA
jgi:hypothetical protein